MKQTNKKRRNRFWLVLIILPLFIGFFLLLKYLLNGKNIALLNPKGVIAQEQFNLMVFVVAVLLLIAVPTLTLLYFTAWRYRESNTREASNVPKKTNSFSVAFMWLIPIIVAGIIASAMWPATHRLAPQKSIASEADTLTIQVITLRWKWLFLYPDQQIATVNFVHIPVDTPVRFELTADETPMSSFWIPNLGGQLYSMTSHENVLNLMAETPGDYPGSSAEINGSGFAGMRFTTRATSTREFNQWVKTVKQSPQTLDSTEYSKLLQPSESNPATFYSSYDKNLYEEVLLKYNGSMGNHSSSNEESDNEHGSMEGHE